MAAFLDPLELALALERESGRAESGLGKAP